MLEAVAKNVALARAKRARASLSRELAELNMSLNAELNETRPLAKLGQRSDEIIHDMGNPLTILTCCIELLQTKVDEMKPGGRQPVDGGARLHPDDQEEHPALLRPGGHLAAIARRYLPGPRGDRRAGTFLNEAVGSLQPHGRHDGRGVWKPTSTGLDDDAHIEIDATQMRRVVHNLIINAMQATAAGKGKVIVRAAHAGRPVRDLAVTDNGSGIPAGPAADDLRAVLLDQGKRHGPGAGDFQAHRRGTRRHACTRRARSGAGSTFTVRLPVKVQRRPDRAELAGRDAGGRPSRASCPCAR